MTSAFLDTCPKCEKAIAVGEWPFCPHGKPTLSVRADGIPGGMWIENIGPKPVKVESSTEWRRAMKKAGVRQQDGNRFLSNAHD